MKLKDNGKVDLYLINKKLICYVLNKKVIFPL